VIWRCKLNLACLIHFLKALWFLFPKNHKIAYHAQLTYVLVYVSIVLTAWRNQPSLISRCR